MDFALDYEALVRAVTSPFVAKRFVSRPAAGARKRTTDDPRRHTLRRSAPAAGNPLPDEVRRVHEASLEMLAEVGCMFHSQAALDVLAEHGADGRPRDDRGQAAAASSSTSALATLPHSFVLGGRTPEYDLPLDGEHAYLTSDGCAAFVREADGTVRASHKADVADAARLVQGLPNISATSALVSAQDCPERDTRAARVRRLPAHLARSTPSSSASRTRPRRAA